MTTVANDVIEDQFVGEPELTLRWRLYNRQLPLKNRHYRTLAQRGLTDGLISWIHQHIEWTLPEGSLANPCGVLQIRIDTNSRAQMEIVDFVPLAPRTAHELIEYAATAGQQGDSGVDTDVAWIARAGRLIALTPQTPVLSGANSLLVQLAEAQHITCEFDENAALEDGDELFLASDEFGFVPSTDRAGELAQRFAGYWERFLTTQKR